MQAIACVSLSLACCAALAAQIPNLNELGLDPRVSTYATRAGLPLTSQGVVTCRMDAARWRGSGQVELAGNQMVGRLNGFRAILQTDTSAPLSFGFTVIADDAANPGLPDPNTVLFCIGPLTLPGSGVPTAYTITANVATPFDGIPLSANFHPGVQLCASPTGTTDSISIQAASWSSGTVGDNPRIGTPQMIDTIDTTNGNLVAQPVEGMTLRLMLLTEAPVIALGADVAPSLQRGPNPAFGAVGIFPDHGPNRADGLAWRLADSQHPNALIALMAAAGPFGPELYMPGLFNRIWLDTTSLVPATIDFGVLPENGVWERTIPLLAWPVLAPTTELHFQALVLPRAGGGLVTNAVSTF